MSVYLLREHVKEPADALNVEPDQLSVHDIRGLKGLSSPKVHYSEIAAPIHA